MRLCSTALLLAAALTTFAQDCRHESRFTDYVNPWIGTGGHGHVFLGANVPFGLVQLGPTEHNQGWDWCSGYHVSDSVLVGFGHMHLSGTGIGDLGDIGFLPVAHCCTTDTKFSHANETVRPGYYAIRLQEPNVFVELTATQRVGFQRYTFGADVANPMIRLDLKQGIGWDNVKKTAITQESPTTISGFRQSKGWADNQQVFFAAEFSTPVKVKKQVGDTIMVLTVEKASQPVMVKCALSAVSIEDAKANLKAEIPGWDFKATVAAADKAWNDELGKIAVDTDDANVRTIFYTALYHTMTAPSVFCDVTGRYRGADGKVHQGDFTNYTTFSLWDTYRAAHPLMTLIHPEKQRDIAATLMHIFEQQGKLPVWHLMGNETDCMVGNPGVNVLADLVLKGFVADRESAFQAMKTSAMLDERGMNLLKQYDYLPYDKDSTFETVAKGLEYALADDGIARVARLLGKKADYKYFYNRSRAYSHYFDPKTGFMRGLGSDGKFREPFDPFNTIHRQDDYTEGNAWQYTWLVPHDVGGLVRLFGGEKKFVEKFDSLFIVSGDLGAEASPDISGLIGQYAHGNEPSHHVIYMYNYIGQPWKAARLLRQTMREMYFNDYDGLSGNEDVGQMSAWYVLSSIGLYQVEPAGGKFVIGTPIFHEAKVNVGGGKTFTVKAVNNSAENIYVQSARLNGKTYTKSYLMYQDIMAGGILELEMGSQPSAWGTQTKSRP
jgi:predicted alpha-1,2-mannosidase